MAELSGMKEICNYVRRSEVTVLIFIRRDKFPAKKIGGIWESDTNLIQEWRKNMITGESTEGIPSHSTRLASQLSTRKAD